MGSNSLISPAEAAKILETNIRGVRVLVQQQFLRPHYRSKKPMYLREEVMALREVREVQLNPRKVAAYAARAYATSRSLERRIEMLETVLDLRVRKLPCDEEAAVALYLQAKEALVQLPSQIDEVMRWASIFLAIGEEFLDLLEAYTSDENCWQPFHNLSQRMLSEKPCERFSYDKILETAYGYFEASVRNLNAVCYFHLRNRAGPNTADRIFHERPTDEYEEIISIIAANRVPT